MKISLPHLLLLLLLVAMIAAGIIFWPWFYAYLIQPVTLALWAVLRVFLSIHQKVYWALLIALTIVLVWVGLVLPHRKDEFTTSYSRIQRVEDRIQHWRETLRYSKFGDKENILSRKGLQDLYRLCLNEDPENLQDRDISDFLFSQNSNNTNFTGIFQQISSRQYYRMVTLVIDDIESKMEIKPDDQ